MKYKDGEGVPFARGEPLLGLSLPEQLLGGGSTLDELGNLFNAHSEAWRKLLGEQEGLARLRRDLDKDAPALILGDQADSAERGRWRGLVTTIAREARLLCYLNPLVVGRLEE